MLEDRTCLSANLLQVIQNDLSRIQNNLSQGVTIDHPGDVTLGSFLTIDSPTLSFNVSYNNSQFTGSVSITAGAADLHVGSLTAQISPTGSDILALSGTYSLNAQSADQGLFSFTTEQFNLGVTNLFSANTSGVAIGYDPTITTEQQVFSFGSLGLTLTGLDTSFTAAATQFDTKLLTVYTDGFDLAASTETVSNIHLGSFLSVPSLTVTLPQIAYRTGSSPSVTGSVGLVASSASMSLGNGFTANLSSTTDSNNKTISAVNGTYDIGTHAFSLAVAKADLTIPQLLTASATGFSIGYDPTITGEQQVFSFGSLGVTLTGVNTSFAAAATQPNTDLLTVYTDGFDLAASTDTVSNIHLGSFLSVPSLTVTLPKIAYRTGSSVSVTGTVGLVASSASMLLGNGFTANLSSTTDANDKTVSAVNGTYDIGTHAFSLAVAKADLTIPQLLTASATGFSISYDPTITGEQKVFSFGSLGLTLTGLDTSFTAAATQFDTKLLTVYTDGFDLAASTETVSNIHLGSFLSVPNLTVTLPKIAYRTGSSVSVTGTVGLVASSATLTIGTGLTANLSSTTDANNETVAAVNGTYDIGTHAFSLAVAKADLTIPQLLTASATGFSISYDPTIPSSTEQTLVSFTQFDANLIPLNDVMVKLTSLSIFNDGFTLGSGTVSVAGFTLGSVLSVTNPAVTISGVSFKVANGNVPEAKIGTIGVSGSASLFPGATAFTATVSQFSGSFNFNTNTLSASASEVNIQVGDFLEFDSTHLAFTFGSSLQITAKTVAVSSPRFFGVAGSLGELDINSTGFSVGSVTLGVATAGTPVTIGSIFSFANFQITVTDFSFIYGSGQATFGPNSLLTVSADSVNLALGQTTAITASAKQITGSIGLGTADLGDFTFSAGTVTFGLGSYLTLNGSNISFNTSPGPGQDIADFGSISAALSIAGLNIGGSATNFSISSAGLFVPGTNFGVSFSTDVDSTKLGWPKWLPVPKIANLSLEWPQFTADPLNFTIDLTASLNAVVPGTDIQLDGGINDLKINTGLLASGKFPIVGLGGVDIQAGGTIFGNALDGAFIVSLLNLDGNGNIIKSGDTTVPAQTIFYGAVEAKITIAGMAGFDIRLGLSEYGPLVGYVSASFPIPVDPAPPNFAFTNFHAGIRFDYALPTITDARQLAHDPAFSPQSTLTLDQWNSQLQGQVQTQAKAVSNLSTDPFALLEQPFTLQGGATLIMLDVSGSTFNVTGDILLSVGAQLTNGKITPTAKFLIDGSVTIGGSFNFGAKIYGDVSQLLQGNATFLMDAEVPSAPNQILTVYGGVSFNFPIDLTKIGPGFFPVYLSSYTITVTGGVEVSALGGADINVNGKAVFTVADGQNSLDILVSGSLQVDPLGTLANVAGKIHYQNDPVTLKPEIWGAIALQPQQLPGLQDLGLTITGIAVIRFNSTGLLGDKPQDESVTLDIPQSDGTTKSYPLSLPAKSMSFYVQGDISYSVAGSQYFDLNGILDASFVVTSTTLVNLPLMDPYTLRPIQVPVYTYTLDVLGVGTLSIGPKASPYAVFNANGFFQLNSAANLLTPPGIAAEFNVSTASGGSLDGKINASGDLKLDLNTTGTNITYTVPNGFPNSGTSVNLPASPVFEGNTIGNRTPGPYLEITGSGGVSIVSRYGLSGKFGLLVTPTELDAYFDASLTAGPLGNVGTAQGLLIINSTGIAGSLVGTLGIGASDSTFSFGRGLVDSVSGFDLRVNTTPNPVSLPGFTVDQATGNITTVNSLTVNAGTTQLVIGGGLTIKGMKILDGEFDMTLNASSLTANLNASLEAGPLGRVAGAQGSLTIDATGIFGNLQMAAGAGIKGTGFNFGGSFELAVNDTPTAKTATGFKVDPSTGAISTGPSLNVAAYAVELVIGGDLNVNNAVDFLGQFSMALSPTTVYAYAFGTLAIGPATHRYANFAVNQSLEISYGGLVASVGISLQPGAFAGLGAGLSVSGALTLEVNTSLVNANYTVPAGFTNAGTTVTVPGIPPAFPDGTKFTSAMPYIEIAGSGDLSIQGSYDLSGQFGFLVTPTELDGHFSASLNAGPLGNVGQAQGELIVNLSGIVGDVQGQSIAAGAGYSFNGEFQLTVNTDSTFSHNVTGFTVDQTTGAVTQNQTLTLAPRTAQLIIGGTMVAGGFNLAGAFDMTASQSGLNLVINATASVFNQNFTISGNGGIYANDSLGAGGLVFDVYLGAANFSDGIATINGNAEMIVNSSPVSRLGIAGQTYFVNVTNTQVRLFGFTATGNVSIGVSNGLFRIDVPATAPLTLSFLSFGNLQLSGNLISNGTFNLTADGSVNLLTADSNWGLYVEGSLVFNSSNATVTGHLDGYGRAAGVNLATVTGDLFLSQNHYLIHAQATLLGVTYPAIDFDLTSPSAPPPVLPPVITFSVPSVITVNEGAYVTMTATVTEPGQTLLPFNYQDPSNLFINVGAPGSARLTSNNQPISEGIAGQSFTFYFVAPTTPGQYFVSVEALANTTNGQSPWQSNQVKVIVTPTLPNIASVNLAYSQNVGYFTDYESLNNGDSISDFLNIGFSDGGIDPYSNPYGPTIYVIDNAFGDLSLIVTKDGKPWQTITNHAQLSQLTDYQRALYPIPHSDSDTDVFSFKPNGPGDYQFTLVANHDGYQVSSQPVSVQVTLQPPVFNVFNNPTNGYTDRFGNVSTSVGSLVTFSAHANDILPVTYWWLATTSTGDTLATWTGPSFNFVVGGTGYDLVTVVATNSAGATATYYGQVGVLPSPIIAANSGPIVNVTGSSVAASPGTPITMGSTVSDPNTAVATAGYSYYWQVLKNGNPFATGMNSNITFTPDDLGNYVVELSVTDATGITGYATHAINDNDLNLTTLTAPHLAVAGFSSLAGVSTGPITVATFSDVNLAVSINNFTATVSWGDGQVSTATAANGGIQANSDGTFSVVASHTYAQAANGLTFNVTIQDASGASQSASSTVNVGATPVITKTLPSSITVTAGSTAVLSSGASGTPTPTVQWQVSLDNGATWNNVTGATTTTYSFTTTASENNWQFRAVFTNVLGTAKTNATILTVGTVPVVLTSPSNIAIVSGAMASFTAKASGTPTPSVQWQVSVDSGSTWNNISGATSSTYSFAAASTDNGKQYRAVFTNSIGSAATTPAVLSVAPISVSANVIGVGVKWGTKGSAVLVDATGGTLLPSGRTVDIPWANINQISITLNQSVSSLSPSDVSVSGSVGGSYGPVTVTGSGTSWMITFAKVIANADKVTVVIGNSQLTSYQRILNILPGDVNDDGAVTSADVTLVNSAIAAPYNVFDDFNGDGLIDINDLKGVKGKVGTKKV